MGKSSDFVIENGVLKKYAGPGGDVVIPTEVTEIGNKVFANSKTLTDVIFPENLKTIGVEAFANCNGLTSVTIPYGVKEIREGAFDWCKNLKDVFVEDLSSWCRIDFGGVFANCGNPLSAGARLHVKGELLTELVIPENIKTVGNYAFYRCTSLESIIIPEGVSMIGNYAFFECANLNRISFPKGLTNIGTGAFLRCKKLTEAKLPETLTNIGEMAFLECRKLKEIILPEGVEMLGNNAFGNCGKLKVSVPGNLKRPKKDMLGRYWRQAPFSGNVCSIQIPKWSSWTAKLVEGCTIEEISTSNYTLIPGDILLPVAVKMTQKKKWNPTSETGKALLEGLKKNEGKLWSVALKEPQYLQLLCDYKLISAKNLDTYLKAAEEQKNTEAKAALLNYQITLGIESVAKAREKKEKAKEVYNDARAERAAKRDPVNGIEGMTFVITGRLRSWPMVWRSRKQVEEYLSRYGAKLGTTLTKECDYLVTNDTESGSEKNEKAKRLGVEIITEDEFNEIIGRRFKDVETIVVPPWVKTIETAAFSVPDWEGWKENYGYKNLKEVVLPESITEIGLKAFAGAAQLERISLPDRITSIGSSAFAGCVNLKTVKFPQKLVKIGGGAFSECIGLVELFLPEGLKMIEAGAFRNCENLKALHIPASVDKIESMAFDNCSMITIYSPDGSFAAQYAKRHEIPIITESYTNENGEENIETLGTDMLDEFIVEHGELTQYLGPGGEVVIPESVRTVNQMAFFDCKSLKSVVIPESVTSISFFGCSNLTKVNIPGSVTSLDSGAFYGCSNLDSITIPLSVKHIGKNTFYGCKSLKYIVIPSSVVHVDEEAFSNCDGLETVVFSEGVESLGKNLFFFCKSLQDVYLPASLNKIDRGNFFTGCTLHVPPRSYAEKYAKKHKIVYVKWDGENPLENDTVRLEYNILKNS